MPRQPSRSLKRKASNSRERRQERLRDTLKAVALALVREHGPSGLTLRELARRMDYTPAGLYPYFGSKEQLLAELGRDAFAALGEALSRVPADLPPARRIVALGEAYLRFAREHREHFLLVFRDVPAPRASWAGFLEHAEQLRPLLGAVEEGLASGALVAWPGQAAGDIVYGLWATVHGLAMLEQTVLRALTEDAGPRQRATLEQVTRTLVAPSAGVS